MCRRPTLAMLPVLVMLEQPTGARASCWSLVVLPCPSVLPMPSSWRPAISRRLYRLCVRLTFDRMQPPSERQRIANGFVWWLSLVTDVLLRSSTQHGCTALVQLTNFPTAGLGKTKGKMTKRLFKGKL